MPWLGPLAQFKFDQLDLWVGGLAEDHVSGSMLGELFHAIIVDQFHRVREGDRYFLNS